MTTETPTRKTLWDCIGEGSIRRPIFPSISDAIADNEYAVVHVNIYVDKFSEFGVVGLKLRVTFKYCLPLCTHARR